MCGFSPASCHGEVLSGAVFALLGFIHDEHHEIGDVIAQALSPFSGVHVARLEQTIGTQDPDWGHLLATAQKRA
jgi:hypothetical protein